MIRSADGVMGKMVRALNGDQEAWPPPPRKDFENSSHSDDGDLFLERSHGAWHSSESFRSSIVLNPHARRHCYLLLFVEEKTEGQAG